MKTDAALKAIDSSLIQLERAMARNGVRTLTITLSENAVMHSLVLDNGVAGGNASAIIDPETGQPVR